MSKSNKQTQRQRRKIRIRSKIFGSADCPRMTVYCSLIKTTVQLVNDEKGVTIAFAASKDKTVKSATEIGKEIAEKAKKEKVSKCVFDRNGFAYQGRVKAIAEAARENGLNF